MKLYLNKLLRWLIAPLLWLAATLFLIEEAIWDWSAAFMARLGAVRAIHAIELRLAALPPRWALPAFLLPSSILVPAKLIGLHAIAHGHWLFGSTIFILAKIVGMALFSRIFNLTRPALMQLGWFARFYAWVMHYRNRIHAYLEHWPAYQRIKQHLHTLFAAFKNRLQHIFSRRRE
jgi:hypothetical protein